MATKPDPTKDPEFQKVVQSFLRTKPAPHKSKKAKPKPSRQGRRSKEFKE
jgi:hypothetical protein